MLWRYWIWGYSLNEVGRQIGCAAVSVMRWRDACQHGGETALDVRSSPGRPPRLYSQQRNRLLDLLLQRHKLWTTARIARLIEREFGIRYHRDHVGKLMHSLQWSPHKRKPARIERDENGFPRYNPKDLEALKRKPRGWAPSNPSESTRRTVTEERLPWPTVGGSARPAPLR